MMELRGNLNLKWCKVIKIIQDNIKFFIWNDINCGSSWLNYNCCYLHQTTIQGSQTCLPFLLLLLENFSWIYFENFSWIYFLFYWLVFSTTSSFDTYSNDKGNNSLISWSQSLCHFRWRILYYLENYIINLENEVKKWFRFKVMNHIEFKPLTSFSEFIILSCKTRLFPKAIFLWFSVNRVWLKTCILCLM